MSHWRRSFYLPVSPLGEGKSLITGSRKHLELSRRIASEGIVLLKNDGALPLCQYEKVALFGIASIGYQKGGGGSGQVFVEHTINLYEGLLNKSALGKISIYQPLGEFYREEFKRFNAPKGLNVAEYPEVEVPNDLIAGAVDFAKTAIYIIGRSSGEGYDRKGGKGDFYLDDNEEKLLRTITEKFEKVIVVIDSGAQMDVARFAEDDGVNALVYAWQAGCEGGMAIADVLTGEVNPSGRLVDTFARKIDDYPSTPSFSESIYYTKYEEDIFVGYRYFETIPGAKDKVIYPFGYGLSYTTFELSEQRAWLDGDSIKVSVTVKNTGEVAGRDVVEVYSRSPEGKLTKAARELRAYKKTKTLAPGESEAVEVSFKINAMASYDDTGAVAESAYVLEKGEYKLYAGHCVRCAKELEYKYTLDKDVVVEQLTPKCVPYKLEKRLKADGTYDATRDGANTAKVKEAAADFPHNEAIWLDVDKDYIDERVTFDDVYDGKITLEEFMKHLTMIEKVDLLSGTTDYMGMRTGGAKGPFNGRDNIGVSNTCGIGNNVRLGIPPIMTADGPAGLRLNPETDTTTTAWPIATMLACTWNEEIVEECGKAAALEIKENNIGAWLAPGMNIHRNPLCGRNFEYYSEDPLLAGKMASAMVRGIQSVGVAATPKHFVVNNRENNRCCCDSVVSERALREIYLKGFEICVKEADPWLIMSSYNLLNGTHTSESHDLLTGILKGEWDYKGCVISDWAGTGKHELEIKAGNDVKMPWGHTGAVEDQVRCNQVSVDAVNDSVRRVLEFILKLDV